jgi:hypothetical protein
MKRNIILVIFKIDSDISEIKFPKREALLIQIFPK